jgi:3-deoxy-D-manno-octulosonate 8-phosphate phosphatase (KDO 8-P phosphatase)
LAEPGQPNDAALIDRLKAIRMLLTDVDGVLTDGSIVFHADGSESKIFNVKDGSGIKYLMRNGIDVGILSARACPPVLHRAENLSITHCITGALDKLPAYRELLAATGLTDEQICYVGDDLPDIPVMRFAGLPVAVADAVDEAKQFAAYITQAPGGRGAIREVAEMILKAQGLWDTLMERYL